VLPTASRAMVKDVIAQFKEVSRLYKKRMQQRDKQKKGNKKTQRGRKRR